MRTAVETTGSRTTSARTARTVGVRRDFAVAVCSPTAPSDWEGRALSDGGGPVAAWWLAHFVLGSMRLSSDLSA